MAKVSTATIRLVQKLNSKNKNGEFPIYVVVCFNGRLEKATKISCLPRFWDSKREIIKNGCPNATVSGLASLLSRSPNTIATYVHQLTKDEEIASMVEGMVI